MKYNGKMGNLNTESNNIKMKLLSLEKRETMMLAELQMTKATELKQSNLLNELKLEAPANASYFTGKRGSMEEQAKLETDDSTIVKAMKHEGRIPNFFQCPYEFQEIIFMMVKKKETELSQSKTYVCNESLFNEYYDNVEAFSQKYNVHEAAKKLQQISKDKGKLDYIQ